MKIDTNIHNGETITLSGHRAPVCNSPLVNYALSGLQRCWMSDLGRWSHIHHLDRGEGANESLPSSDVFYTLNVLLGISRVIKLPDGLRPPDIFERNIALLEELPVAKYTFGMALWAAAVLGLEIPAVVEGRIVELLGNERRWWKLRAQDLGMLLVGVVAQVGAGRRDWVPLAHRMYEFLISRYRGASALFCDAPAGYRRRIGTFATQTYLTLACYYYGEFARAAEPIKIANACTRKLIALQGPQGEWPWLLDAQRGSVLDFYEVYSVHQYGMAPAFLEFAERHGVRQARNALVRGFNWVLGDNQLGIPMLIPDRQLSIRSQVRRGELKTKGWRVMRAVQNACLGRSGMMIDPMHVALRRECRSYELGWILWSFGRRSDLSVLTHNPAFLLRSAGYDTLHGL